MVPQNPDDFLREAEAILRDAANNLRDAANNEAPLHEAEAILRHAWGQSTRLRLEEQIKAQLQEHYPYPLQSLALTEQLGHPLVPTILKYLRDFGEIEQASRGHYRALAPEREGGVQ
jgi:hypothetical protein